MAKGKVKSGVKPQPKLPPIDLFDQLMLAAYNMGPAAEPGTRVGAQYMLAAIATVHSLHSFAFASPGSLAGVLCGAKLFVEVMTADDPEAYLKQEIEKGFADARIEEEGAGRTVMVVKAFTPHGTS